MASAETSRSRAARKMPSAAEAIVWSLLRNRQTGFKFRREVPMLGYRLDFYCAEAKLAVELDGEQHDAEYDQIRDQRLADHGILVVRIPNRQFFMLDEGPVEDRLAEVVALCRERAAGFTPHP